MASTQTYVVTDRAGPKVAGRRALPKTDLELTENEARSELLAGTIVKKGEKTADPFKGSDQLKHIQARASGLDASETAAPEPKAETGKGAKPPADPPATAS